MQDFTNYLLDQGLLDHEHRALLADPERSEAEPVYYALLRQRPELEGRIWQALAEFLGIELIDPTLVPLDRDLARLVPARLAHRYSLAPLSHDGAVLEVAVADPRQFEQADELAMLLREEGETVAAVQPRLARPSDIAILVRDLYGIGADTVQDMLETSDQALVQVEGREVVDLTQADSAEDDAAIVRFVNELLLEAVKIGASDIHLEPYEQELRVRYRVDGLLQPQPVPTRIKALEPAIISRLKIMADLDIAEKRLPQDGQIRLTVLARPIDVRVSVLPTLYGQGLALRLLDRREAFRRLEHLGMPNDYLGLYRQVLDISHGVILVTGPTGSGKTTTLYASLNELNQPERKIITVEDPIEYQLEGISQIHVRRQIGLTFAHVLRSILRHDPDIIMIGEIRDSETARIAISAAMTGHLVFSTLHTNDAPSAPVRLLEMGLEPYLVSSALEAVLAQRLVRRLCLHCRQPLPEDAIPQDERPALIPGRPHRASSCPACRRTGYHGRAAIYEMFTINDRIRQLVLAGSHAGDIRHEALRLGMRTLRESGLEMVRRGLTSLAEVYRVTRDEAVDMQRWLDHAPDSRPRETST